MDGAWYNVGIYACDQCNFVSDNPALMMSRTACPHCHRPGMRVLFPDPSHTRLMKMIEHFSTQATKSTAGQIQELAANIRREVGRDYDPELLARAAGRAEKGLRV